MKDPFYTHKTKDELRPYDKNSRTHSPGQIAQLAASIKEFGFTNPILIDEDNGIIAGHGRLEAAKQLGLDRIPCLVLAGLTKTQKRALVIADNKLALNAGWDLGLLKGELVDLQTAGFDLSITGFTVDEITGFIAPPHVPPDTDPQDSGEGPSLLDMCEALLKGDPGFGDLVRDRYTTLKLAEPDGR